MAETMVDTVAELSVYMHLEPALQKLYNVQSKWLLHKKIEKLLQKSYKYTFNLRVEKSKPHLKPLLKYPTTEIDNPIITMAFEKNYSRHDRYTEDTISAIIKPIDNSCVLKFELHLRTGKGESKTTQSVDVYFNFCIKPFVKLEEIKILGVMSAIDTTDEINNLAFPERINRLATPDSKMKSLPFNSTYDLWDTFENHSIAKGLINRMKRNITKTNVNKVLDDVTNFVNAARGLYPKYY